MPGAIRKVIPNCGGFEREIGDRSANPEPFLMWKIDQVAPKKMPKLYEILFNMESQFKP